MSLSFSDRADIATWILAGETHRQIGEHLGRDHTIIWRERRRNSIKTRGYRPVNAHETAARRRLRLQVSKIDADPILEQRVKVDLARSRTPRQIAGRLRLEPESVSVTATKLSPDALGRTVSHKTIYRWIHTLPKGELEKYASCSVRSKHPAKSAGLPVHGTGADRWQGL